MSYSDLHNYKSFEMKSNFLYSYKSLHVQQVLLLPYCVGYHYNKRPPTFNAISEVNM